MLMKDRDKEYCTPQGAKELQDMIASYWRKRGHDGAELKFEQVQKSGVWCVRSNMIDGFPPLNPVST
jgi:hypothetical protein